MSNLLDDLTKDLRYAARLLRSAPMFTIVVVAMLALGIGANTAIFSVMNAVVLRSMPVPNPQQLVYLKTQTWPAGSTQTGNDGSFPVHVFETLRTEREIFSDVMAFVPLSINKAAVRYGTEPEEAYADMVSGNFFSGLGVGTVCGRTLTLDDEKTHAQVAVLGHGYWSRRFGQTCSVLGETIYVRGVPFTIVGVAAKEFVGVEDAHATDIWVPLQDRRDLNAWGNKPDGTMYTMRNWWCLMMIGRLAPGVSDKEALAKVIPIFQRAAYAYISAPKRDESRRISISSLRGESRDCARPMKPRSERCSRWSDWSC